MEFDDIKKTFIKFNYEKKKNYYYSSLFSLFEILIDFKFNGLSLTHDLITKHLTKSLTIHEEKNKKYNGYLVHILSEDQLNIIVTELYNLYIKIK